MSRIRIILRVIITILLAGCALGISEYSYYLGMRTEAAAEEEKVEIGVAPPFDLVEQIKADVTLEAGTKFIFRKEDYFTVSTGNYDCLTVGDSVIDTAVPGEYTIDVNREEDAYQVTVRVEDTVPPVMSFPVGHVFRVPDAGKGQEEFPVTCQDETKTTIRYEEAEWIAGPSVLKQEELERFEQALEQGDLSFRETLIEKASELGQSNVRKDSEPEIYEDPEAEVKDGFYLLRVEGTDLGGNHANGCALLIVDNTAPVFSGIGDQKITVASWNEEWEPDLSKCSLEDAFDGVIEQEKWEIAIEEKNPKKHQFAVVLKAVDKSGNPAEGSFTVTLKKKSSPSGSNSAGSNSSDPTSSQAVPEQQSWVEDNWNQPGQSGTNEQAQGASEPQPQPQESAYSIPAYAQQVLELVNQERANAGLAAVSWDSTIASACDVRAAETVQSFSHTRPDGRSCFSAMDDAGVSYMAAGENIAAGQGSPESVMNAWMNSPGHRGNILDPGFGRLGVACYYDPGSSYGFYWVQLFAD